MATDKTFRGNASQFFVAGELCRRGFYAVITLGIAIEMSGPDNGRELTDSLGV